jgi:hypothetical protein
VKRSDRKEGQPLGWPSLRSEKHAQDIWQKAHDNAVETYGEGERAHRVAYAALKHEYEKRSKRKSKTSTQRVCSNQKTIDVLNLKSNPVEHAVRFGKLAVVKRGTQATVIAVGPMLSSVLPAVEDMDVTVLYLSE